MNACYSNRAYRPSATARLTISRLLTYSCWVPITGSIHRRLWGGISSPECLHFYIRIIFVLPPRGTRETLDTHNTPIIAFVSSVTHSLHKLQMLTWYYFTSLRLFNNQHAKLALSIITIVTTLLRIQLNHCWTVSIITVALLFGIQFCTCGLISNRRHTQLSKY
jgi:hypothetical protein